MGKWTELQHLGKLIFVDLHIDLCWRIFHCGMCNIPAGLRAKLLEIKQPSTTFT